MPRASTTRGDASESDVEFNPSFAFDASSEDDDGATRARGRAKGGGGGGGRATTEAWRLGDAREARARELRANKMTSVDEKIARARGRGEGRGAREGGSEDEYGSDSEDAPLPGEDDGETDDDASVSGDGESVVRRARAVMMTTSESEERARATSASARSEEEDGGERRRGRARGARGRRGEGTRKRRRPRRRRRRRRVIPSRRMGFQERAGRRGGERGHDVRREARSTSCTCRGPLTRACEALGYKKPTPIQAAVIPIAMTGRDVCGRAVTGEREDGGVYAARSWSGCCIEDRGRRRRRTCWSWCRRANWRFRVHQMTESLAQFTTIRAVLVVGGLSANVQAAALRTRPEIVVATPGRVIDHVRNTHSFGLEDLATLILDEADRLLEMGFLEEIKEIVRQCPKKRQTLLFSATLTARRRGAGESFDEESGEAFRGHARHDAQAVGGGSVKSSNLTKVLRKRRS